MPWSSVFYCGTESKPYRTGIVVGILLLYYACLVPSKYADLQFYSKILDDFAVISYWPVIVKCHRFAYKRKMRLSGLLTQR